MEFRDKIRELVFDIVGFGATMFTIDALDLLNRWLNIAISLIGLVWIAWRFWIWVKIRLKR